MLSNLLLRLDDDDRRDVFAAMEERTSWGIMPDEPDASGQISCEYGQLIGEICRGWLERVRENRKGQTGPLFDPVTGNLAGR